MATLTPKIGLKKPTVNVETDWGFRLNETIDILDDAVLAANTAGKGTVTVTDDGAGNLTISGSPHVAASDVTVPNALIGVDGITVTSGTSEDTITGFRAEFVNASGTLQTSIDAVEGSDVDSVNSATGDITIVGVGEVNVTTDGTTITVSGTDHATDTDTDTVSDAIIGGVGIVVTSGVNTTTIDGHEAEDAITGSDGNTVTSGTSTVDIAGFRTEFVNASGTLQTSIDTKIGSVSEDTTPQLGGDLDAQSNNITSVGLLTAVTGTFSQSLTVSGLPVLTGFIVKEEDNSPLVAGVHTIIVTTGTLTDEGGGVVSLDNLVRSTNESISGVWNFSTALTVSGIPVALADSIPTLVSGAHAFTFTNASSVSVIHSLNTKNIVYQLYNSSDSAFEANDSIATTKGQFDFFFDSPVTGRGVLVSAKGLGSGGGTTNHSLLSNLSADDHPQYSLVDGTRGFLGTVSGVDPVDSGDLTTKNYVDSEISTVSGSVPNALIGADGITVTSGTSEDTLTGFRTEFVNASGSLQTQIDTADLDVSAITVSGGSDITGVIDFVGEGTGNVSAAGNTITFSAGAGGGGGGLSNIVEDLTPELGANLDALTNDISNVGILTATTVTGTTVQVGGAVTAGTGDFSNSLTISGIPVGTTFISKSVTIQEPTSSEDFTLFFTEPAITINGIKAVIRGSSPSLTINPKHSTDRSAAGNTILNSATAVTSTVGVSISPDNDNTVPANSWVWLETTALGGSVAEIAITFSMKLD